MGSGAIEPRLRTLTSNKKGDVRFGGLLFLGAALAAGITRFTLLSFRPVRNKGRLRFLNGGRLGPEQTCKNSGGGPIIA